MAATFLMRRASLSGAVVHPKVRLVVDGTSARAVDQHGVEVWAAELADVVRRGARHATLTLPDGSVVHAEQDCGCR